MALVTTACQNVCWEKNKVIFVSSTDGFGIINRAPFEVVAAAVELRHRINGDGKIHHFNFLHVAVPVYKETFIFIHIQQIHMKNMYRSVFFFLFFFKEKTFSIYWLNIQNVVRVTGQHRSM